MRAPSWLILGGLFACGAGCATLGDAIKSSLPRVDSPLLAQWTNKSQIVLAHGDTDGVLVVDINGTPLTATREQLATVVSEGTLPQLTKGQRLVVALEPGDHVTVIVSNQSGSYETVNITLKLYSRDQTFLGATAPKTFEVPPAPGTSSWSWVFTSNDLR